MISCIWFVAASRRAYEFLRMDLITVIIAFCALFYSSTVWGDSLELTFDTQIYDHTDDYYAHMGDQVILTCCVSSTVTKVNIYKGTSFEDYNTLVRNGEPRKYLTSREDKYSFESSGGKYKLTIYNLDKSDSLYYACSACRYVFFGYCIYETKFVYLDVKITTEESEIPDFCDLVNNTYGIFFTGNDLILRCPNVPSRLEASYGSSTFSVYFDIKKVDTVFNLVTIKNLTSKFNETKIRCIYDQIGDMNKDYCSHFPKMIVFNELKITLSPGDRQIESGENVTFTCHSHPYLPFSSQWNISDSDVTFDNFSISEIPQGSRLSISNIKVHITSTSSWSSLLTVTCIVTIGSQKGVEMVSVYPRMQDISTTRVTSLASEISSLQAAVDTTMSDPGSDEFISPVSVVVPAIIGMITLGIVILVLVYIKLRKPSTSNIGPKNMSTKQGVVNVTDNAYDTMNNQKAELGLTFNDSEVVDNGAYISYDEDYKQG